MNLQAAVDQAWRDIRYAWRLITRERGFAAVVIVTLALAVAANTAIYSVIDAVMFRRLPFEQSERLVSISRVVPNNPQLAGSVSAVHFDEWRRSSTSFEGLSLISGGNFSLTGTGEPENIPGARVSASLFSVLRVPMQLGRTFLQEDEDRQERVVVVSDDLWRTRLQARVEIVGQTITLNGVQHIVIGVLPPGFSLPLVRPGGSSERMLLYVPIDPAPFERDPRSPVFAHLAVGRLKAGVQTAQATAELNGLQRQLAKLALNGREVPMMVRSLQTHVASGYRAGLLVLWAGVTTVLLITCVNVANLLLARAARRRRELAVRAALGASRMGLVRQLLIESLTLSAVSGALGVAGAFALLRVILAFAPGDLPRVDDIRLDTRVLLFTMVTVVVNAVLFGVGPAWWAARTDPQDGMRIDSCTASSGPGARRLRDLLVSAEVALCVACLVVGALLLRSFQEVRRVERGFETAGIVTVTVGVPTTRYPGVKRAAFLNAALDGIETVPGVVSTGLSSVLPISGDTGPGLNLTPDGLPDARQTFWLRAVNGDYFNTMGIPIREGRSFVDRDVARPVAVVSALTAERVWGGASAIGKRFRLGPETSQLYGILFEVVGVVGDARGASLTAQYAETVYLPHWQDLSFIGNWSFLVKTRDPNGVVPQVRAVLRDLDAALPIPAFRTMDTVVAGSLDQRRFQTGLIVVFGVAGLLLAGLGIYGVVSYTVAQRTAEIGIRMALGARTRAIQWLVVRQGLGPLLIGLAVGIVGSLGAERLVGSMLFGVRAGDLPTTAGVAVLLTVVTLAASAAPARRATRIDPVVALRSE